MTTSRDERRGGLHARDLARSAVPGDELGRGASKVADFDYQLPRDRIADVPAEPRDAARLLVHEIERDVTRHLAVSAFQHSGIRSLEFT